MSKLPSMPLFTDVFISDTVHLTNEELGIYVKLLCFAWTKNGSGIIDDATVHYRICGAFTKTEQELVGKIINEFFYLEINKEDLSKNAWYNSRLKKEWEYTTDLVDKRRNAGIIGQQKLQQKRNKTSAPTPIPKPIPINLFNIWWSKINNKIGKGQAEKTFCKGFLKEDFAELENKDTLAVTVLLDNLAKLYNEHCVNKKEFAQHPSTWLNAKGYLDNPMNTGTKDEFDILPKKNPLENYVNFVKKGVHTTFIDDTMVREMFKKGLITEKEKKDYGV